MNIQNDFLRIKELRPLSDQRRGAVHRALENLMSPQVSVRLEAIDRLVKLDAHRRSPLVVSILAQRLKEPDSEVRARIARALADCLRSLRGKWRPPCQVHTHLKKALSELGEQEIICVLELVTWGRLECSIVCELLRCCPMSGDFLCRIANSHQFEIRIRLMAVDIIGANGILEAIPTLEALERKLAQRAAGQLAMKFAPQITDETEILLPTLRRALEELAEASI